jgi:hypothetical protein
MAETRIDSPPTDPDDPDHPWNRVQQSLADLRECSVSRELRSLERAWLAGSIPALADAVALCGQHARPLPDWATDGVQRALAGVPGNNAGKLDVHYSRWDAVGELRDRKEELSLRGYKPTWEAAYGDAETIKKSYQLIQRLFK